MPPTPSPTPFRILAVCASALLATTANSVAAQAAAVKDSLVKRSGERLRGVEIIELGAESVKFRRAGAESSMPASQLLQVEWTDPPDTFDLARGALERGDSDAAANLFIEAATKAAEANRKALEAECKFLAGRALALGMGQDAARAGAAKTALTAYLEAFPNGFRVPEARLRLASAQRIAGDVAGAEASLKALEEQALQHGLGLIWDARAKLERGQLALAQGNAAAARTAFQGVRSAVDAAASTATGNDATELEGLRMLSVVSEGETFLRENKLPEAMKYFSQLATTSRADNVRAAALAGEAQAMFLQTGGKVDVKVLREAQMKLAQATLLDTASSDSTAKALFLQGKILLALGPSCEPDTFKQRSREYFESVVKHYPTSSWASDARVELQKK